MPPGHYRSLPYTRRVALGCSGPTEMASGVRLLSPAAPHDYTARRRAKPDVSHLVLAVSSERRISAEGHHAADGDGQEHRRSTPRCAAQLSLLPVDAGGGGSDPLCDGRAPGCYHHRAEPLAPHGEGAG